MYCRHCYAELRGNARFCMGCSMPVEDPLESLDGVINKFGNLSIENTEKLVNLDSDNIDFNFSGEFVSDEGYTDFQKSKKLFNFWKRKNRSR